MGLIPVIQSVLLMDEISPELPLGVLKSNSDFKRAIEKDLSFNSKRSVGG